VRFSTSERTVDAVKKLSFHIDHGETLAVVGESGSGKSVTSLALMRLVEHGGGRILDGRMAFRRRNGEVLDLAQARDQTMRGIRGADIAMIFQEPMTSLNPVFTAGDQIAEAIRIHQGKSNARPRAPKRCACWSWCAFPKRATCSTAFRTSSRAACASA
jgi:ABC-type dipeptide/oligopeptide/nickel transport system ATPase component